MIDSIDLKNFKCFNDLHLEMSSLNVLTGINSMGKSTAIQSLLLLRQSHEMNLLSKGLQLNGKYIQIGRGKDLMNRFSDEDYIGIKINSNKNEIDVKYNYSENSDFLKIINGDSSFKNFEEINLFKQSFSFISASRIGPRRYYEGSFYEASEHNQVGTQGELFADYLAIKKGDKIFNKNVVHVNNKNELVIEQANSWLSEISPSIKIDAKIDNETGIVSLQYDVLSERFSPLNVGFGLSYVAPIVVSLLKAQKDDLLIIENPEAHLHPSGQRKMGELIAVAAAGGVQIIVETHSDHLLNGIRLAVKNKRINRKDIRINYFYRELSEIGTEKRYVYNKESPAILDDGKISSWPDGFFDEWDKALMDLI